MTHFIVSRFKENNRGFWHSYHWFIIVFTVAVLCDSLSTVHFMLAEGTNAEIHPAIEFVSSKILGPVVGPLFGGLAKTAAGIVLGIYCRKYAGYIFVTASIISFWAAWYNIWGSDIYTPNILKWIPW